MILGLNWFENPEGSAVQCKLQPRGMSVIHRMRRRCDEISGTRVLLVQLLVLQYVVYTRLPTSLAASITKLALYSLRLEDQFKLSRLIYWSLSLKAFQLANSVELPWQWQPSGRLCSTSCQWEHLEGVFSFNIRAHRDYAAPCLKLHRLSGSPARENLSAPARL